MFIRWVLFILIGLIIFANLLPWLQKIGIGKLPGDVRFKLFGKIIVIPFSSTIVITLFTLLIAKLIK